MHITSFWAKGYRSLLDIRLDNLGGFNVFYGPNGAGKSNILSAMQVLFELIYRRTAPDLMRVVYEESYSFAKYAPGLSARDRSNPGRESALVLGMQLEWQGDSPVTGLLGEGPLVVEINGDWSTSTWQFTRLEAQGFDLLTRKGLSPEANRRLERRWRIAKELGQTFSPVGDVCELLTGESMADAAYAIWINAVLHRVGRYGFALVGADRSPSVEHMSDDRLSIIELLGEGRLKEALGRASRHKDRVVRQRYREFKQLMEGPPLERPPFDIIEDQDNDDRLELVEVTSASTYDAVETPLDLAGLGIAQMYSMLAQCMLSGARSVAIEEPEAHLHAPTSGMDLRKLLVRLVKEQHVDQLFIATHSNLFDLDSTGYWDISKDDERGTQAIRKTDLNLIDREHLYEPGPAKHALLDVLRYLEPDEVAYRRTDDGDTVTVNQMIELLQADDPLAKQFLDDIHGAAVRAVRVQSKRKK